jgi:hypothetical protein
MKTLGLLIAMLLVLSACSAVNIPTNVGLRCACAPDAKTIEEILNIAARNGFPSNGLTDIRYLRNSVEYGSWAGPPGLGLTLYLSSTAGKLGVVVGDRARGGEFSDEQKKLIRKLEIEIVEKFPGKFTECHWDFQKHEDICVLDGVI